MSIENLLCDIILPHHALIFSAFSPTTMAVTPVDFSANNVYVEKKCVLAWSAKRGGHGMWSGALCAILDARIGLRVRLAGLSKITLFLVFN